MELELVAFDFNGTFLADTQACLDAANTILRQFKGEEIGISTYRRTLVFPTLDFYVRHGCNRKELLSHAEEIAEVWHGIYEARVEQCRTRRGSKEVLKVLRNEGIATIVVSNHTQYGVQRQIERLQLGPFNHVLANPDKLATMDGKNKAQRLEEHVREMSYSPLGIWVVGDAPEDVEMGKRIHARTVALTGGCYDAARLKAAQPDYMISCLTQLIGIVKERKELR